MERQSTSRDYGKTGIVLVWILIIGINIIALLTTRLFPLEWNSIDPKYLSYRLSLGSVHPFQIHGLLYWVFHYSIIHSSYVTLIFLLAIYDKSVPNMSAKDGIMLIGLSILMAPLVSLVFIYPLAAVLSNFGLHEMDSSIKYSGYFGSSSLAWSFVGIRRTYPKMLIIPAFLFPFVYKLLISRIYDFTPDIGHLVGFIMGYVYCRYYLSRSSLKDF